MDPRSTASGSNATSGAPSNTSNNATASRRSMDRTPNVFSSMMEYRDSYRLQHTIPAPQPQRPDKYQARISLSTPRPKTHGMALSSVPRSTGPGPPHGYQKPSAMFSGGTSSAAQSSIVTKKGLMSTGPCNVSIKNSPKVKIFQKKYDEYYNMKEKMHGSSGEIQGIGNRETVIHNGLQQISVESTPQVVYETKSPRVSSPAIHRHLPNVSGNLKFSNTSRKKTTKKTSSSPLSSVTLLRPSSTTSTVSKAIPSSSSSSSTSSVFAGGSRPMIYPPGQRLPVGELQTKIPKTQQHTPLPAHSRPTTPAAGLLAVHQQPITITVDTSATTKDIPLDLSRDMHKPLAIRTGGTRESVLRSQGDGDTCAESPLDLSVKKRSLPIDCSSSSPEPATKKQAIEVGGLAGNLKFARNTADVSSMKHRSAATNSPYIGITFGTSRMAPIGIATATTHSIDRIMEGTDSTRTPRPAHLPQVQPCGLNNPLFNDLPSPAEKRAAKDLVGIGRRSPILPGGKSTVRPSLRHSDVVNVRGKPFKVSTVRPQVNGRPVVTARTFSPATTTSNSSTVTIAPSISPPTANIMPVNGTIGTGPLGCLQLSNITRHAGPPVTAEASSKHCEPGRSGKQIPTYVTLATTNMERVSMAQQSSHNASTDTKPGAGAESSEESESSACQTPVLNIPKFKPSKTKSKGCNSKKKSRPPLVISIPDQINTSSAPTVTTKVHSAMSSVQSLTEDSQHNDMTQCVSISTQTVDETESSDNTPYSDNNEDVNVEVVKIIDDFPPPDEPVDMKELYPTPSRTLMCARKSTTKQSKRLLQQILESRSPPKLSVISPGQKAPTHCTHSPPPHMPILSPHQSPPTLLPQAFPNSAGSKVKLEPLSLERNAPDVSSMNTVSPSGDKTSDCDCSEEIQLSESKSKSALSKPNEKERVDILNSIAHSRTLSTLTECVSKKKSIKSEPQLDESHSNGSSSPLLCASSIPAVDSKPKKLSLSCSNSPRSESSSSLPPTEYKNSLFSKLLVARSEGSPMQKCFKKVKMSGSRSQSPSIAGSDSETSLSKLPQKEASKIIVNQTNSSSSSSSSSSSQGNIFEKFQALADEARGNFDADTSDELSLMCWERMEASPPSGQSSLKLSSPQAPIHLEDGVSNSSSGDKDNVDTVSVSSENSNNSVIAKALPKVTNVSAFMPTKKTEIAPLHYAAMRENIASTNKRCSSPIENTRFYHSSLRRSFLNRSSSSPSLEVVASTRTRPSRHSSSVTRGASLASYDEELADLDDWQMQHVSYQTTKLRRPATLITIPRSASETKGTPVKRLSPEGLYDFCPSSAYAKAKACMFGPSHAPVFTPIRNVNTQSVHGMARLASMDGMHHTRSARTVAEFNRQSLEKPQVSQTSVSGVSELPQIITGDVPEETWTMVKEASPRKVGSPAAARNKESSGTLVTVLRRERSRDDSISGPSKSPIQFQRERMTSPDPYSRPPTLERCESEPAATTTSRSQSPASACSLDGGERMKLTVIYSSEGKVKIGHCPKKKSKSSKPERHKRCSYTIKGDALDLPVAPRDPTSPRPKLSPIRLVASPPRKRKPAKKPENKSPPGSPKLTFVNTLLHVEPSSAISSKVHTSDNQNPVKHSNDNLAVVVCKKPKINLSEVETEVEENSIPVIKPLAKSQTIISNKSMAVPSSDETNNTTTGAVTEPLDNPTVKPVVNPSRRVLSPLRLIIKSPAHMGEPSADSDVIKDKNILYDLPTSPDISSDETPILTEAAAETATPMMCVEPAPVVCIAPTPAATPAVIHKKKDKKSSKKHKKEKKRDGSKEKGKLSDSKKEKKEKKNREKDRDLVDSNPHEKEKSSKKSSGSKERKEKSEKKMDTADTYSEKEISKKKSSSSGSSRDTPSKSTPSKKKEGKEHRKKSHGDEDDTTKVRVRSSKKIKLHKRKIAEKRKQKAEKRRQMDNEGGQTEQLPPEQSEKKRLGKKKKSSSRKSKKQLREEKEAARNSKPKRRSILDELANSDGYVAEKRLEKKCRDLYSDPAKLGREERALLRAMMQFNEMEQSDSTDQVSATSEKPPAKKVQTSARSRAQALTRSALKVARNRGEMTIRKTTKPSTSDTKPCNNLSCPETIAKQEDPTAVVDNDGQWQIAANEQKLVVPVKRKRGLMAHGLTMKIQWKSALWEKYVQNHKYKGRLTKAQKVQLAEMRRRNSKRGRLEELVKQEPELIIPATPEEEAMEVDVVTPPEGCQEVGVTNNAPTAVDVKPVKVKQELMETGELVAPLLRPEPLAAPSPAPSASTGLSVGGTEEYWPVPECVKKMSVNQNTGETILHKAARLGYEDVAWYCAQTDYLDLDARDHAGYTAMHECCSQGHILVTQLLVEGGASVNLASCDGMRPLHDAVENDLMEMVRLLLSRGADPKLATYSGKTVLGLTEQKEMLSFLTGYFQDLNGCRQPQPELPWQFLGSKVCEDPEEETGFAALDAAPEVEPEGIDDFSFEFSETPSIPTYFLPLEPVKGAVNYVCVDDVAEQLSLTRDIFLKEYPALPTHTTTVEAVLAHCQCLGTDVVKRLHTIASSGSIKLLEYTEVIRHLLDISPSQCLSEIKPDPELLLTHQLSDWEERVCGSSSLKPESDQSQHAYVDSFDWNEQFEYYASSLNDVVAAAATSESALTIDSEQKAAAVASSSEIYRGLFLGGIEDEDDEDDDVIVVSEEKRKLYTPQKLIADERDVVVIVSDDEDDDDDLDAKDQLKQPVALKDAFLNITDSSKKQQKDRSVKKKTDEIFFRKPY